MFPEMLLKFMVFCLPAAVFGSVTSAPCCSSHCGKLKELSPSSSFVPLCHFTTKQLSNVYMERLNPQKTVSVQSMHTSQACVQNRPTMHCVSDVTISGSIQTSLILCFKTITGNLSHAVKTKALF